MEKVVLYTSEAEFQSYQKGEGFLASVSPQSEEDLSFEVSKDDITLFSRPSNTYEVVSFGNIKWLISNPDDDGKTGMKHIATKEKFSLLQLETPLDFREATDSERATEARYFVYNGKDQIAIMFQVYPYTGKEHLMIGFYYNGVAIPIMDRNSHQEVIDFVKETLNIVGD